MATLSCGHVVHRTFGNNGPCDLEKKLGQTFVLPLCLDNSKGLPVFAGA